VRGYPDLGEPVGKEDQSGDEQKPGQTPRDGGTHAAASLMARSKKR